MELIQLKKWNFHYMDCPEAWYKGYQDSTWEAVTVPHDWSVHMPFSKDYSSGTGYLAGGIGWYRTSFYLPEEYRNKRIFITFDGVYKNSQVWCNSYYMGKRPYGYSTFRYDITEQACFGELPNIIAVRVDHTDIADSRWFTGSGITRKVTVSIEEPVHPEFQGIFFTTPAVTAKNAEIEIVNSIINDTPAEVTVTIESQLTRNSSGDVSFQSSKVIPAGETGVIVTKGSMADPALWSVETPNLYRLTTRIDALSKDGSHYTDAYDQTVGIRKIQFDADKGFFLNDKPLKIKGVCVHHDAGCLGAAVPPQVWLRRLSYLKEMGCNAIRMSHNPHTPELYDLCDTLGFLVMDEAFDEWEGAKNKWSVGHNVYPPKHQGYFEDFVQWHEKDLADLIRRDRNHPSIIMWSIGNEIDYPNDPYCHPMFTTMTGNNDNNKPKAERQYNSDKPNAERLSVIAAELTKIVKAQDTTRPVTAAAAFPELSTKIGFIDSFDVVGYNYKEQYYENDHISFPNKPFLGSENSHSYQAWKAVRDQEYISAQFLWTGIDYLGEAHGWPIRGSRAGVLTTAGFPKVSYFRRKSFWSGAPMVYLATARADAGKLTETDTNEWKPMYRSWNYLRGEMIEVRCYTNLPYAELFCNGISSGVKQFNDNTGYITWFIPYEAGELSVIGKSTATDSYAKAKDSIKYTRSACNIELQPWKPSDSVQKLISVPEAAAMQAGQSSESNNITQLELTITDGISNHVTNDSTMLFVEVTGSGRLLGLENGELSDLTEYSAAYRRAYEGRLIIYIADADPAKATTVTVRGEGLRTAVLEF